MTDEVAGSGRALSKWTEAIGVLGVIASLIFVGVEIRNNTRAVRGSTFQALAETSISLLHRVADNPELGAQLAVWGEGAEMDPATRQSVESEVMAYLRHLENAHYQMLEGTLEPQLLENWASNPGINVPYFETFWNQRRAAFGDDFATYLEGRLGF